MQTAPVSSSISMLNLGIFLALLCAVVTQLGFLYKHKGANEAPQVDMRHPLRSVKELFSSKWFAIGMAVATSAWFFHVAALAFAPMSVVQAVLSTGVVLLAVMAERLFGFKVGARQWIGVGMTAGGLFLLVITLPSTGGNVHSSYSLAGMIAFEAAMLAIGALLITGPRMGAPDHHHGVMLGGAAGVLFGVSDVAIKALTGLHDGFLGVILSPWLLVAILGSIIAFYASARGLQDGEAVPVIASTSTAANVSCILGGIIVFGDPMPADVLGIVVQIFAFVMVVVAALVTPPPVRAAAANALGSGEPQPLGGLRRLVARVHAQLAHDALDVRAHGLGRDHERVGDLDGRALGAHQADDLPLARGQRALDRTQLRLLAEVLDQVAREPARDGRLARRHGGDRARQRVELEVLRQVARGAGRERAHSLVPVLVAGEDDDGRVGVDAADRVGAVEEHDVGREAQDERGGFRTGARLGEDGHARLLQDAADQTPRQRVGVGDDNAEGHGRGPSPPAVGRSLDRLWD